MTASNPRLGTEVEGAEFLQHHAGDGREKIVNPSGKSASSVELSSLELQEQCRALQLGLQLLQELLAQGGTQG